MKKQWIAIAALLISVGATAQIEMDIKAGDNIVSAMTMGVGEHAVIALHGAGGNTKKFFFEDRGA